MMYLLLYSFLHTEHFGAIISHKMFFSCISMSSLAYVQRFYSKRKLVKTSLKLVSAIFYQILIFSPNDSPSKTAKNVFYFI